MDFLLPYPALRSEVARRLGMVPKIFIATPETQQGVEGLWAFAVSAYLENPIPSLFKERLFVSLSRFCEARYCIVRHCAFLLGYGFLAGDPSARPQTVDDAIRLLNKPTPWERGLDTFAAALETAAPYPDWPEADSDREDQLFGAIALISVETRDSARARKLVRRLLDDRRYDQLLALLAYIRAAHYWTVVHSDLRIEDDARHLLDVDERLTKCLLNKAQAAARRESDHGLFETWNDHGGLKERRELIRAKNALREEISLKELLLKEVDHRIRNSLQIVSSILRLQSLRSQNDEANRLLRDASARVLAIAAVHRGLYSGSDFRNVCLCPFLTSLCRDIGEALGCADHVEVEIDAAEVSADIAIPLALALNELLTNAIKYGRPPYRVILRIGSGEFVLVVSDGGEGPSAGEHRTGLGSHIVKTALSQLGGSIETILDHPGYLVKLVIPLQPRGGGHESSGSGP